MATKVEKVAEAIYAEANPDGKPYSDVAAKVRERYEAYAEAALKASEPEKKSEKSS